MLVIVLVVVILGGIVGFVGMGGMDWLFFGGGGKLIEVKGIVIFDG